MFLVDPQRLVLLQCPVRNVEGQDLGVSDALDPVQSFSFIAEVVLEMRRGNRRDALAGDVERVLVPIEDEGAGIGRPAEAQNAPTVE